MMNIIRAVYNAKRTKNKGKQNTAQIRTHTTPTPRNRPRATKRCQSSYLVAGRKRDELDVRGRQGVVAEGALDGVEVVRTDGDECATPADILMQLVLRDADARGARGR